MNKKQAVICLSGGMDSGVLLAEYVSNNWQLFALSFAYGSKHNAQELRCAKALAERYGVSQEVVELQDIGRLFQSSLLSTGPEIPSGNYDEETMKSTVVPFRNAIMISIAVGYAESIGASEVLIASHSGDHRVYPDCRPGFNEAIRQSAELGTDAQITVSAPYESLSKVEIAKRALAGFDFCATYTCYQGEEIHCGSCPACNERRAALTEALGTDPTEYRNGP